MLKPRYFNTIEHVSDNVLRKSSKDYRKICAEYSWYSHNNFYNTPKVSNLVVTKDDAHYDMEYIDGKTLAEHYVDEDLPVGVFIDIFQYIAQKVKMSRIDTRFQSSDTAVASASRIYGGKTLSRLGSSSWQWVLDKRFVLNGWESPSVYDIIRDTKVDVSSNDLCFTHGDLCFSNIILKKGYKHHVSDLTDYLYFVDPRGLSNDGELSVVGDYRYDIGKLGHSVIGLYDLIKYGKIFAVRKDNEITYDIISDDYRDMVQEMFFNVFSKNKIWYDIMIHLFLSMIPLHEDNPIHQDTMLATAINLFKERETCI